MTTMTKELPSTPTAVEEGNRREQQLKAQGKGTRQELISDPTGTKYPPRDLDSLSDEQLRKLTKANTKKNNGGRSSRLRSQVERVFRRLDNLAADVKLQPRYAIDALPVVSPRNPSDVPQNECTHAVESADHGTPTNSNRPQQRTDYEGGKVPEGRATFGVDQLPLENEEFEIEPATNNSAFTDSSNSLGVQSGSARSVRISTSVTVLDYVPAQSVSIAQLQRFDHPTRTGKCLQTRKFLAEETDFPPVIKQRVDQSREGENQIKEQERNFERRGSELGTISRARTKSPPPPRRTRSAGSTPTAYIVPTPTGPYGSRADKK